METKMKNSSKLCNLSFSNKKERKEKRKVKAKKRKKGLRINNRLWGLIRINMMLKILTQMFYNK